MKRTIMNRLAATIMLAAIAGIVPAHSGEIRSIDVHQAQEMKNRGVLLLDVREPSEYASSHAPGSVLIPVGQLEQRLKEIQQFRNQPVVVICRSGRRSAAATDILQKAGFSDARNVEGGMIAWEKAGLPVVQGAK